jgi:hypothetical protein
MSHPAYCILRAEKLTTFGSIIGSAKHTFREIPTPNADASRTHLNRTFGAQDAGAVCAAIKARLPAKRRKDAVLAIEYLVTASPEWFRTAPTKQQNAYFAAAVRWLEARHGKANIVCVNVQLDETSPHLVVYVAPLTSDGRLSAKDYLGGRKILSQMQTEFADLVGKPVGLQRGVEGSKAVHTTNKEYNAALKKNPTLKRPVAPAPSITDRLSGRAGELLRHHEAELDRYAAQVEQARNAAMVAAKSREAQARAVDALRDEVGELHAYKQEADKLRHENNRLRGELERQKAAFLKKIDELKALLKAATEKVGSWMRRAGLLEQEVTEASAQADELRRQLEGQSEATGNNLRV